MHTPLGTDLVYFAFLVYFVTPSGAQKKFLPDLNLDKRARQASKKNKKTAVFGPFVAFFVPDLSPIGPFRATAGPGCRLSQYVAK